MSPFWRLFLLTFISFLVLITIFFSIEKGDAIVFVGKYHHSFFDFFFLWVTRLGEIYGFIIFAGIYFFMNKKLIPGIALSGILTTSTAGLLKSLFKEPRPHRYFWDINRFEELILVKDAELLWSKTTSFPSGHTTGAFALMSFLIVSTRSFSLQLTYWTIAVMVGLSRIYLNHHFLKDTIGGMLLGVVLGSISFLILEYVYNYKKIGIFQ